ncbi:DUF2235 domain-containing protein [Granulicella sp. dw_53]|uniref:DUF2235 domain-containing protein n=1 Tax=Granulicella sp. dw_53 TaxID=2719792 RepID=UPI001BD26DC6
MSKKIVICIDGTGNEFGICNSNVIKLYSVLGCNEEQQLAFYHPGLGTMAAPTALTKFSQWWTRMFGLAFGYGLSSALEDCYGFLMEHYEDGDEIYLFGFSRGAYCARALAAMVHMFGLVRRGNDPLIRYILRMFKKKGKSDSDFKVASDFKKTFSRECKIHFVGVWDTVSSIGWLYDPLTLPFSYVNPSIIVGRQAISIDERRAAFRQNLMSEANRQQDIKQVWFAGVHSDVGGGYPEAESGLSKITLKWMLDEAEAAGLLVIEDKKNAILGITDPEQAAPNPAGQMHRSMKGSWCILEMLPRRHYDGTLTPPRTRWKVPRSSPRRILANALIDSSVTMRMAARSDYRPINLPKP